MDSIGNGNGHPSRRWHPDALTRRRLPRDEATYSGRRFVIAGVLGISVIWGLVTLGFRAWRADYRERADFGTTQIAPLVDPLANLNPPEIDPVVWRSTVADTHGMLVALAGSGLLDRPMLEALRGDVATHVARSTPSTVVAELTALWDALERKAGPTLAPDLTPPTPGSRLAQRHPRPARPVLLRAKRNS